ncbi:MAG: hypothetical protein AB2794_13480 [Candidatus Thiodiazotropha endolucinida]
MKIADFVVLILCFMLPTALTASPWKFERAIDVSGPNNSNTGYFHHIDSSGRRNIAVSEQIIAIAWEDDRDGTPRIYLAHKKAADGLFNHETRLSGGGEAYEPSLVAISGGRFVIAWEEDGYIHARMASLEGTPVLGPIVKVDSNPSSQVNLTTQGDRAYAVWSQRRGRFGRIHATVLRPNEKGVLEIGMACPVDAIPPTDEQLYPAAVIIDGRLLVTWEDRRPKHTIIMAAVGHPDDPCRFSAAKRISEKPEIRGLPYGSGHGVSRVALGHYGHRGVFAAWEDKRDFRDGYDIWGAPFLSAESRFGSNVKLQDDFGELAKQRHAALSGHRDGTLVAAWDDEREGNTDVVLSWQDDGVWSDDWLLPVASGEGHQSNPSIMLDTRGDLHIIWIERQDIGATTRLKYARGRRHIDK